MKRVCIARGVLLALIVLALPAYAQDGGDLRTLLKDVELGQSWVYDDVDAAFARAKATGKPVLALFR